MPTSWATWSGGNTPAVLHSSLGRTIAGTFTVPVYAFGLEMEPNYFEEFLMTLRVDAGGRLDQYVHGYAGAKFFGWVGA
ncbi:MAG: hypothetical protein FJ134_07605 [Deltaproteobacteria bacterium]|nr:hypothetical protein [Deltaproteobacteria bacterium]